jgi:hypothetical protein
MDLAGLKWRHDYAAVSYLKWKTGMGSGMKPE